MNKLKLFSTLVFFTAIGGVSKAQFDFISPTDIDEIHKRTLIVVVEKPTDFVTQKLDKKKKQDKLDTYKAAVDAFNKNFASVISQYWKVTAGDIEYKTLDDLNDINDKRNYAVIFCRSATQPDLAAPYINVNGLMWWPDIAEELRDKDFSTRMTVMGLALLDKFNKTPCYQFPMPNLFPTKEDLIYAVNGMNNYINYHIDHRNVSPKKINEQMLEENQPTLKDKTLLIRRDWIDKRLTKAEIEKDYPFPYMIAGKDTVNNAIDSADSRYAIAIVAPYDWATAATGGVQYVQYVYNIENGAFLACSGLPEMPSNPKAPPATTANSGKPLITKKSLLDFCLYITDNAADDAKKKGHR